MDNKKRKKEDRRKRKRKTKETRSLSRSVNKTIKGNAIFLKLVFIIKKYSFFFSKIWI